LQVVALFGDPVEVGAEGGRRALRGDRHPEGNDRRGLYADVAAAVSSTGTDIKSMDLRSTDGRTNGSMLVEVENLAHLEKIIRATRKVKGITEVARRERLTE
jgi:GTP pyrophosphokinase